MYVTPSTKTRDPLLHYELVRRTVLKNRMRDKVWLTMTYVCDRTLCGHEERVLACVGVEGPRNLRFSNVFLEATATLPAGCPECDGSMTHDMSMNEYLDPPQDRSPGLSFFRVPGKNTAKLFVKSGLAGVAEYVDREEQDAPAV